MLTLTLPSHGSYQEILEMVKDSPVQVKIMRDATIDMPELEDDYSHARGKTEITREMENILDFQRQWYCQESDNCSMGGAGEVY